MSLAIELLTLYREIDALAKVGGIDQDKAAMLAERIRLTAKLANSLEIEVLGWRGIEAARFGREIMEEASTDANGKLITGTDGNVVQADFGRRS